MAPLAAPITMQLGFAYNGKLKMKKKSNSSAVPTKTS